MSKKSGFHRQIWPKSVTHLHGITPTFSTDNVRYYDSFQVLFLYRFHDLVLYFVYCNEHCLLQTQILCIEIVLVTPATLHC